MALVIASSRTTETSFVEDDQLFVLLYLDRDSSRRELGCGTNFQFLRDPCLAALAYLQG